MTKHERMPYQEIKSLVLSAYYDFCRDRGVGLGWSHEQILGSVSYEYENVFALPLENLMLRVVQLVLSGGWYKDGELNARNWVTNFFSEYNLDEFLEKMPVEESEEFYRDLKIAKLI